MRIVSAYKTVSTTGDYEVDLMAKEEKGNIKTRRTRDVKQNKMEVIRNSKEDSY